MKKSSHSPRYGKRPDPMRARFVPLNDMPHGHPIYQSRLTRWAILGGLAGAALCGWLSSALAEGSLPVAGLGQFAAAGWGVATFTGAGVGFAGGGLSGGLIALRKIPRAPRHAKHGHSA